MSATHKVKLGPRTVEIAGYDLSGSCLRYTLQVAAGNGLPLLQLDLMVVADWKGEAIVALTDSTRAALEALGWTPPPEE